MYFALSCTVLGRWGGVVCLRLPIVGCDRASHLEFVLVSNFKRRLSTGHLQLAGLRKVGLYVYSQNNPSL